MPAISRISAAGISRGGPSGIAVDYSTKEEQEEEVITWIDDWDVQGVPVRDFDIQPASAQVGKAKT